jgi:hypothetical protein
MSILQELCMSESEHPIAKAVNSLIDMDIEDTGGQSPFLCALRQGVPDYSHFLLDVIQEQCNGNKAITQKIPNLQRANIKHGYPIHMAILSHKFEIALRILNMKHNLIDPHITTSIGANIIHLLFVKYDKDPDIAFKILLECVRLGVDVNLVDDLDAAPIHVALRKRQYQVINDCIRINMQIEEPLFNLNLLDKKGMTGLHYAVDKQDHDMFLALIQSSNLDIF